MPGADEPEQIIDEELDQLACTYMEKLLPTLNKDYAYLIKELELN
jgi:hypothetical protein